MRRRDEEGAVLVLVLVLVNVVALTLLAVAKLALDAPKGAGAQQARQVFVAALDGAALGMVENLRLGGPAACTDLPVSNDAGLTAVASCSVTPEGYAVRVSVPGSAPGEGCPDGAAPLRLSVAVTVTARVADVRAWTLTTDCPEGP